MSDLISEDIKNKIASCFQKIDELDCTNATDNYKCNRANYQTKIKNVYNKNLCTYKEVLTYYNSIYKNGKTRVEKDIYKYLQGLVKNMNTISEKYLKQIILEEKDNKNTDLIEMKNNNIVANAAVIKNQLQYLQNESGYSTKIDKILEDDDDELGIVNGKYNTYLYINIALIIVFVLLLLFKFF
jgi:transcriptional regulator CtsR